MARPRSLRSLTQKNGNLFRARSSSFTWSFSSSGLPTNPPRRSLEGPEPGSVDFETSAKCENSGYGSVSFAASSTDVRSQDESADSVFSHSSSPSSSSSSSAPSRDKPSPPSPEPRFPSAVPLAQSRSSFFRKLPPEVREQIYLEYWRAVGIDRHVYLEDGEFCFAPCITDHDIAFDECQVGLAADFRPFPDVQRHPGWYDRMTSSWCNHWRCEEVMREERRKKEALARETSDQCCGQGMGHCQDGGERDKLGSCLPLLLACKRLYYESYPSFQKSTTLTITDKDTAYALFIRGRPRRPSPRHRQQHQQQQQHPVFAFLPRIRTLNISLRRDGPDFLYIHGSSLWHALSPRALPGLRKISLWMDGWEPVSRRLLPQFRAIWTAIPPDVARRLAVSLPCGEDGLWAWERVACRIPGVSAGVGGITAATYSSNTAWDLPSPPTPAPISISPPHVHPATSRSARAVAAAVAQGKEVGEHDGVAVEMLPAFVPQFEVRLRGWEAYTANSGGHIMRNESAGRRGGGARRVLAPGNPFEDMKLYGRGIYDSYYP